MPKGEYTRTEAGRRAYFVLKNSGNAAMNSISSI